MARAAVEASKRLQLTLALIKPDVTAHPLYPHIIYCNEIKDAIMDSGFFFVRSKKLNMPPEMAAKFYGEHVGKSFFKRLMTFMTSGPFSAHILARENAIPHWRKLMGPTRVYSTIYEAPDCLRALYGLTDTRNGVHGSDSEVSAKREINFFFPEFNFERWLREEELFFHTQLVEFDEHHTIHIPKCVGDCLATLQLEYEDLRK